MVKHPPPLHAGPLLSGTGGRPQSSAPRGHWGHGEPRPAVLFHQVFDEQSNWVFQLTGFTGPLKTGARGGFLSGMIWKKVSRCGGDPVLPAR